MAEFPAELLADALEAAGEAPVLVEAPLPERLPAHAVLRYAIDDELVDVYRRVMRVMWFEHEAFGLRLRPEQVADRLRARYGREFDREWLEQRLSTLVGWGALERDHDAGLASSAADWRRNRWVYDISAAGQLTEQLLARLDDLGEQHGRLEGDRLPAILDALRRLAVQLEAAPPDGTTLRTLLEQVFAQVAHLHEAALAFMRSLGALIRGAERVDEREFEASKGALLEHLQGFREDRPALVGRRDRRDRCCAACWCRAPREGDRRCRGLRGHARRRDGRRAARAADRGTGRALARSARLVRRRRRVGIGMEGAG